MLPSSGTRRFGARVADSDRLPQPRASGPRSVANSSRAPRNSAPGLGACSAARRRRQPGPRLGRGPRLALRGEASCVQAAELGPGAAVLHQRRGHRPGRLSSVGGAMARSRSCLRAARTSPSRWIRRQSCGRTRIVQVGRPWGRLEPTIWWWTSPNIACPTCQRSAEQRAFASDQRRAGDRREDDWEDRLAAPAAALCPPGRATADHMR